MFAQLPPSRSGQEARRSHRRRGAGCDGPVAWAGLSCMAACRMARSMLTSERMVTCTRGGRPKDPAIRRAKDLVKAQGRAAAGSCKPIKPSRAERRRFPASVAAAFAQPPAVCSPKAYGAMGLERGLWRHVSQPRGAAGAANRPVVPHASSEETDNGMTGLPCAGSSQSTISRVWWQARAV